MVAALVVCCGTAGAFGRLIVPLKDDVVLATRNKMLRVGMTDGGMHYGWE
jgi:hypothetical protein